MNALRVAYRGWVSLLSVAVLVQIGAAGYGAFNAADKADPGPLHDTTFTHGFDFHNGFGYFIFFGGVILFLLALAARLGRNRVLLALAVPLLLVVQILLAWGGESHPVIGIFHPLNAFLILGLTGSLAGRAWHTARSHP